MTAMSVVRTLKMRVQVKQAVHGKILVGTE
jgi:hypothetical protein